MSRRLHSAAARRAHLRLFLSSAQAVLAFLLGASAVIAVRGFADEPRQPEPPSKVAPVADRPPRWNFGDEVGHVTKVDSQRGEVRIDFGGANGAEVGMSISIRCPAVQAGEPAVEIGRYTIRAVDQKEATATADNQLDIPDNTINSDWPVRVGHTALYATDPEVFRIFKLGTSGRPGAIDELLRARLATARHWMAVAQIKYHGTGLPIDRYIAASGSLMEAERDAATRQEEKAAAARSHLDRMTRAAQREFGRLANTNKELVDAWEAEFAQIQAALELARTGRGAAGAGRGAPLKGATRNERNEQRVGPARPVGGALVGHVQGFNRDRREVVIDFGAADGAELGSCLHVVSKPTAEPKAPAGPDPLPQGNFDFESPRMPLTITSLDQHRSVARLADYERRDGAPAELAPTIRPGDPVYFDGFQLTDALRTVDHIAELGKRGDADSIDHLRRIRLQTARNGIPINRVFYLSGSVSFDRYVSATQRLMEAERDSADDAGDELKVIRAYLTQLTAMVTSQRLNTTLDDDRPFLDLPEAATQQAKAAITLLRTQVGPKSR